MHKKEQVKPKGLSNKISFDQLSSMDAGLNKLQWSFSGVTMEN